MQQQATNKKSLGFLSIVAFLMILIGVVYTVSSVFAQSSLPLTLPDQILPAMPQQHSKESMFSAIEKQVADKATSLRHQLLGTTNTSIAQFSAAEKSDQTSSMTSDTHGSAVARIDVVVPRPLPKVYEDIETSAYKEAILILYSHQLIKAWTLFYPNNYVRISDFIRVVMDAYRLQHSMDPSTLEGLTKNEYFSYSTVPVEVMMRVNSAYELWFLQKLALVDVEWNPRLSECISPQEAKDILMLMEKKSPSSIKYPSGLSFSSDAILLKEEMAQLVVSAFSIKLNERSLSVFSDISWTTYQDAIQKLARLWIVAGVNGKFYPDARVENKDFVVMVVRSMVAKQGFPVVLNNFYYLNTLQNVSTNATYAPYLEYCLESQICNSLLSQASWGVSFEANRLLSRSEINTILSTVTKVQLNVPSSRWWERMRRGELAHLLVNVFGFDEISSQTAMNTKSSMPKEEKSDRSSRRESFQQLMKIS